MSTQGKSAVWWKGERISAQRIGCFSEDLFVRLNH